MNVQTREEVTQIWQANPQCMESVHNIANMLGVAYSDDIDACARVCEALLLQGYARRVREDEILVSTSQAFTTSVETEKPTESVTELLTRPNLSERKSGKQRSAEAVPIMPSQTVALKEASTGIMTFEEMYAE